MKFKIDDKVKMSKSGLALFGYKKDEYKEIGIIYHIKKSLKTRYYVKWNGDREMNDHIDYIAFYYDIDLEKVNEADWQTEQL